MILCGSVVVSGALAMVSIALHSIADRAAEPSMNLVLGWRAMYAQLLTGSADAVNIRSAVQ